MGEPFTGENRWLIKAENQLRNPAAIGAEEKLALDWKRKERALANVRYTMGIVFDRGLPEKYDEDIYREKCDAAFLHVLNSYQGAGQSVYAAI